MGAGGDYEYVGGWRRDVQHGQGVLVQKGVLKYTGELLSGLPALRIEAWSRLRLRALRPTLQTTTEGQGLLLEKAVLRVRRGSLQGVMLHTKHAGS